RHLIEAQEMRGVEVRLYRAAAHDVDSAVQQVAQPEDHSALDLTLDRAGIDDDAGIDDHGDAGDGDLALGCDAGLGDTGVPGVVVDGEGNPLRGASRERLAPLRTLRNVVERRHQPRVLDE